MADDHGMEKVCLVGSGNWGSAVARIVGTNTVRFDQFHETVNMWVYEEEIEGRKLTEIINTDHVNVKYLPDVKLPGNVVAIPDLAEAVKGATIIVFVLPHQFLHRLLPTIKANLHPRARAISLIKGVDFDDKGLVLISDIIRDGLGVETSVLMGANVAGEVAKDQFSEATIGCKSPEARVIYSRLFQTVHFNVNCVTDTHGVELCGALKNIVALGAGFCDGLGFGTNTKAAIIRLGLVEMRQFAHRVYGDHDVKDETFFESCGVADLITTCFGGRNRRCAEAFVKTGKDWNALEEEMLNGQKLQGTLTAKEVYEVLKRIDAVDDFPLFTLIYRISFEGLPAENIVQFCEHMSSA